MKVSHLIYQFRNAFGFPTHGNAKGAVSVEPLLTRLREMGIRTETISYTSSSGSGENRVLKLQIAAGSGKNRMGRQLHFNKEQQLVHDSSRSLDSTSGQTSRFRGHDPRRDTNDYFE